MAYLERITVFPIKSLDGMHTSHSCITKGGSLIFDREFALFDKKGKIINGKRTNKVHLLRASFDPKVCMVTLRAQSNDKTEQFNLRTDQAALEAWFSDFFGFGVSIKQDIHAGFPDDLNASGPTIISTATLQEISTWFEGLSMHDLRLRFRTNLEIGGVQPFFEDCLYDKPGSVVQFKIGEVHFEGIGPCQRCIVPTRNPLTGEYTPRFKTIFAKKRKNAMPYWVQASRFDHFYRLAVNTNIFPSEAGKKIKTGDALKILGF